MSKTVDITEKLGFDQKPQIIVRGETLTVNDEAVVILKIMPLADEGSAASLLQICPLLFSEEDERKINDMHLNFRDFTTLVKTAIALATGTEDNAEGETPTRATT